MHRPAYTLVLISALTFALTGCTLQTTAAPGPAQAAALTGLVHGGQQPVSYSTIQLYAAGTSGYASAATPLIPAGSYYLGGATGCVASSSQTCYTSVTTDATGSFNIPAVYTCPTAGSQIYIVATNGNPGLTPAMNNTSLALMSALGTCSNLSSIPNVTINELTTIAAVYALAPFMSGYANVGSSSTNTVGLQTAFATSAELVSPVAGLAVPSTSTTIVPQAELNTLGNILAACVNSNGSTASGTACAKLISATTPTGGTAPANTIAAALSIALNPFSNPSAIFALGSADAPFQTALTTAPLEWSISLLTWQYSGNTPAWGAVADSSNNYWSLNFGSSQQGQAYISGPQPQDLNNGVLAGFYPAFGQDGTLYTINGNNAPA